MKLLKPTFVILFSFFIGLATIKAQHIDYYYDNAGNRTERTIIMPAPAYAPQAPDEATAIDDVVSEYAIKIYPNPTKGHLAVEVVNAPSLLDGQLALYDSGGRMLENATISSSYTTLDLSAYPSGVYILRIQINDETINWKIIKE